VPVNCVISSDGKSHVFLLDGKHASRRSVETGLQNSKYVQIDSGLQKGQLVIVKGARFLSNGDAVRLSESSEPEL
jgi:multidrug efflux pump subunit AcrA (membrane-fusion protein)